MIFSRDRDADFNGLNISTADSSIIERVTEYKYLGIWLDEKLTFKSHVDKLVSKLRQKIGFFYRNRANFPMISRKRVIEAVFMSVLDYGDVIYRNASSSTLKSLDAVYHSALRFITGDIYSTHHCILYNKVGWSSLSDRRNQHWLLFIYKTFIGKHPPYISDLLNWSVRTYHTRSSEWLLLQPPPLPRTDFGMSAFNRSAPNTWNTLQYSTLRLTKLVSIAQFRALVTNTSGTICTCFY